MHFLKVERLIKSQNLNQLQRSVAMVEFRHVSTHELASKFSSKSDLHRYLSESSKLKTRLLTSLSRAALLAAELDDGQRLSAANPLRKTSSKWRISAKSTSQNTTSCQSKTSPPASTRTLQSCASFQTASRRTSSLTALTSSTF